MILHSLNDDGGDPSGGLPVIPKRRRELSPFLLLLSRSTELTKRKSATTAAASSSKTRGRRGSREAGGAQRWQGSRSYGHFLSETHETHECAEGREPSEGFEITI